MGDEKLHENRSWYHGRNVPVQDEFKTPLLLGFQWSATSIAQEPRSINAN